MKRFTELFNDVFVNIIADPGVVLFNVEDIAQAVGYSRPGSVIFHVKNRVKFVAGARYIDLKSINILAKKATRTPAVLDFKVWAKSIHDKELAQQQAAEHIAKQKAPEATIAWPFSKPKSVNMLTVKEAAEKTGMSHSEFITWMSVEGYFQTYESNGHLKMSSWFKNSGYGINPHAESGRQSNTIRITYIGLEFIKNRLASQREGSVLNFAKSAASERKRLEAGIDKLIKDTFSDKLVGPNYTKLLKAEPLYHIYEGELVTRIKGIIAEVKLKENNNGT